MQIRQVRSDGAALERFVADCWLPYHEALDERVPAHTLAADVDRAAAADHLPLGSPDDRLWVAVDGAGPGSLAADGPLVGFLRTSLEPAPPWFDWPDGLAVEDLWVAAPHRGTGLAETLLGRAVQHAREAGCERLVAEVADANDRALAFFDRAGLEPRGLRMCAPLEDVPLEPGGTPADDAPLRLRRVPIEAAAMRRFVEECWLPFWRDLGAAVGEDHLAPDLDRERLVADLLESYDTPDRRCWVALEGAGTGTDLEATEATVAGWLNAGPEPTDPLLDPPDRLFVGNLYAAPGYRGSGLADRLLERGLQYAREEGCVELVLGVELANDRARAYYRKRGFEPLGRRLSAPPGAVGA